jgi:hypothetical protein|tara:strand:+ start:417 stop:1181 length:765 start_codon:yes stop_codon:yes gene_type:complete
MEYGICILGTIPLRNEANDKSEIVSQVLFGQHFKILEIKSKWIKIKLATDNYEGWICAKQYEEITYEDYDNLCINDFPLVGSIFTRIQKLNSKESIPISMGATLPFFNNGIVKIRKLKFKFSGDIASKNTSDLIKYAFKLINAPYLWGGKSILGIDCSGFTQLVFSLCGIKIPRDAYQQVESGKKLNFSETRPGDLIFFINDSDRIHHVGIALKDDKIIHASGKVRIDGLNKDGILNNGIISHKYHSTVRISEK